jgi:cytochrome P450
LLDEYPHAIDNDHLETLTTVILIFIFVGVHTTTDAVTYCMYSLIKHPEYLDELVQEQKVILKEEAAEEMTPNMYRQMIKLDSFIRESLRVRTVGIGLPHTNVSDHDIILKSGAIVKPGICAIYVCNDR